MPVNHGAAHTLKWRVWWSLLATPHLSTISALWRVVRRGSNSIIQRKSFKGWALWNTCLSFSSRIYGIGVFLSWLHPGLWDSGGVRNGFSTSSSGNFDAQWNLRTASTEIWKICPQKSPPPIRIDDRRKVGRPHSASIGGVLAPSQILSTLLFCLFKKKLRASLVVQWWRIPIVMQGTQVRSLAREDPTPLRAAMPTGHNYWAHVL